MNVPAHGAEAPRPGPARPAGGLQQLDGHFAFSTTLKNTFITATGGGGHTTDAIHTDATVPRSWEWFRALDRRRIRVLRPSDHQRPLRHRGRRGRANHGHDPHGRDLRRKLGTLQADQTSRPARRGICRIRLADHEGLLVDRGRRRRPQQWRPMPQRTRRGPDNYLNRSWELFTPWRRTMRFGTGSTCGILIYGANNSDETDFQGWMVANGGGGWPASPPSALLFMEEGNTNELSWTLLKQTDGTYALQTANGTVLSAVGGGAPGVRIQLRYPCRLHRQFGEVHLRGPGRLHCVYQDIRRHVHLARPRGLGIRWQRVLHQSRPQVPGSGFRPRARSRPGKPGPLALCAVFPRHPSSATVACRDGHELTYSASSTFDCQLERLLHRLRVSRSRLFSASRVFDHERP